MESAVSGAVTTSRRTSCASRMTASSRCGAGRHTILMAVRKAAGTGHRIEQMAVEGRKMGAGPPTFYRPDISYRRSMESYDRRDARDLKYGVTVYHATCNVSCQDVRLGGAPSSRGCAAGERTNVFDLTHPFRYLFLPHCKPDIQVRFPLWSRLTALPLVATMQRCDTYGRT